MARPHGRAASKPLLIIVGLATDLKGVSTSFLRRAFLGAGAYSGSAKLIPINHPLRTPARERFDNVMLGLRPEDVGRFWVDRRIRDQPASPRTVPSAELAVRVVMALPSAISHVTPELLNAKVRVVAVDGKVAGQPGYPLQ